MGTFDFTLRLNRDGYLSDEDIDALYEAGCDDGSIEDGPGGVTIAFHREAETLAAAVASAVRDVESVPGLEVTGVAQDDLVTLADVASRTGRSYESVRLLAAGRRGPGGFPAPVHTTSGDRPWHFYSWFAVATWLRDVLGQPVEVPPHELTTADRLLSARTALRHESDRDRAALAKLIAC